MGDDGQLQLLREAKLEDLLPRADFDADRFEASGVLVADDRLWVVFDNVTDIAQVAPALSADGSHTVKRLDAPDVGGFEDIALDVDDGRYFLLVEAAEHSSDTFMAQVVDVDGELQVGEPRWLELPFDRANKGIEGLTCVRRDGEIHLLGLCEGNMCESGDAGRRPGGGRVHVFVEQQGRWKRVDTIRLPMALPFTDFSSLSVSGDRIAVVSQEASALWVGRLSASGWEVDEGTTYHFPRDDDGRIVYGNVEGVCWMTDRELVVVSDRAKQDQSSRQRQKDQSIHVFALPST